MKKFGIIAALSLLALSAVGVYLGSFHTLGDSSDHNVPGATTGQGRNSLLSPDRGNR
jgi:hypothetical protein